MSNTIRCPLCGQSEPVEKVSTIYMIGIGLQDKSASLQRKPTPEQRNLSRRLAPPSGGRASFTRPVNPDLAVLAFSAILPVFIYGIWTSQRPLLVPILGLLALFYSFFFWERKRLLARYHQDLDSRRAAEEKIKKAVGRWMKLYYCAVDKIVFEPGRGKPVSLDLLSELLLEKE